MSTFSRFEPSFKALVDLIEPHFAIINGTLRDAFIRLQVTWERMALGQGLSEKAFAVALGYAVVGILLSLYLNILTVGNVKSAGRAVRSAVRQQLLVAKVLVFPLSHFKMISNRYALGGHFHFYRARHIPVGLWYRLGSMHGLAFTGSQLFDASYALHACTLDSHILSLGCWNYVHVCLVPLSSIFF
jgi:hypothetical protein